MRDQPNHYLVVTEFNPKHQSAGEEPTGVRHFQTFVSALAYLRIPLREPFELRKSMLTPFMIVDRDEHGRLAERTPYRLETM